MSNESPKNIFLVPCGAKKTREHLQKTVLTPVEQSTIVPTLSAEDTKSFQEIFGDRNPAVWGSVPGRSNSALFKKMQPGDSILFSVGEQVRVVATIVLKVISPRLSQELWPTQDGRVFSLIYFLDRVVHVDVPFSKVRTALGYADKYRPQGLIAVSTERLEKFYATYADVYALVEEFSI